MCNNHIFVCCIFVQICPSFVVYTSIVLFIIVIYLLCIFMLSYNGENKYICKKSLFLDLPQRFADMFSECHAIWIPAKSFSNFLNLVFNVSCSDKDLPYFWRDDYFSMLCLSISAHCKPIKNLSIELITQVTQNDLVKT